MTNKRLQTKKPIKAIIICFNMLKMSFVFFRQRFFVLFGFKKDKNINQQIQ